MRDLLIRLFGGWTDYEYNSLFICLAERIKKEYEEKEQAEEKVKQIRRIALRVAEKYKDIDACQALVNL